MLGTFLVSVAALLVALIGCAWLRPEGSAEQRAPEAEDWTPETSDRAAGPQAQ